MESDKRIQVVGYIINTVMVCATVVMAVATFWMASATRDLAATAQKSLSIEQTPQLALDDIRVKQIPEINAVQVQIYFRNPTRIPITYRFDDLRVTYDGRTAERATYDVMGGDIAAQDKGFFQCYPIAGITSTNSLKSGTITFSMRYWNATSVTNTFRASLAYFPSGNGYEWIKSPSYQAMKVPVSTP